MIDGRGINMKNVKAKNRERIQEWIEKNEGKNKTKRDCCEELGITYKTLRAHLREMDKKISPVSRAEKELRQEEDKRNG